MPDPIIVVEYDPEWPVQFLRIRKKLVAALGRVAIGIEHVGSTSVPELAAKPIIDIDVVIADEEALPQAATLLAGLGYERQGDLGITGREAFRTPAGGYPHHLYVVAADARALRRHMAFRDRLRADPEARAEYAALKLRLAERFRNDRDAYTEAKTELIERLLGEAAE